MAIALRNGLSIDLEVSPKSRRIQQLAAVPMHSESVFNHRVRDDNDLLRALRKLDAFATGASFLIGHNILKHDRPFLEAANPGMALLRLPAIDTLMLSPLAFPRNPYHRLVKHYKDGALRRSNRNDPELDSRIALRLLEDECESFRQTDPALILAWHGLAPTDNASRGFDMLFSRIRGQGRPAGTLTRQICLKLLLRYGACEQQAQQAVSKTDRHGWELAYALAWMSVAGENSVMPPWVRHEYPDAAQLVRGLRDTPCRQASCPWCRERHDARRELNRWMGFEHFRAKPRYDGRPMQQAIVESAMGGGHVLGILPTGTGKSLCYQVPALSRYYKTGALTVVISPLVALMADQVRGMEKKGIDSCAAFNGLQPMPERNEVLDRVRLGDVAILIISPEQLRNRSLRKTLEQREIGAWVLDEAHCLAKWGHAFRPDYRYVSRVIAKSQPIPPIMCLTATARLNVIEEIREHFQKLNLEMQLYNGGAERSNLGFEVVQSSPQSKHADLLALLQKESFDNDSSNSGGAIAYCYSRKRTEEFAEFLVEEKMKADYYHAGMGPERKKDVQQRFIEGNLQIIVATNAFGMGIDKPDVRLVIHVDMPGSLENYVQEAGRAGRDGEQAQCILLFTKEDAEAQFQLAALSRLSRLEIDAVLRSLRRLDKKEKKHHSDGIEVTAGEILLQEDNSAFRRDSATDDTRVRTAVSWLEEAKLLRREENQVNIFPSSLRVSSVKEAKKNISRHIESPAYRKQLLKLASAILDADDSDGISTDQLMGVTSLDSDGVRKALYDLERVGVSSNDSAITAYIHKGVKNSSQNRFDKAAMMECALIGLMREHAPEQEAGESYQMHLRSVSQQLKDEGHAGALPERLRLMLRSLAADGRGSDGKGGSLRLRPLDRESVEITLRRSWDKLARTAELRRDAAKCLLLHWLSRLPENSRGVDLLAETTVGKLYAATNSDLLLKQTKDPQKLTDRALLWLHELEIIRLHKGLIVFRPAMTIYLDRKNVGRRFEKPDFQPLSMHYNAQTNAIHIMAEYGRRGLDNMRDALRLTHDYFTLLGREFLHKWLPGKEKEIDRQTSPESWRAIVEPMNTRQRKIVADNRERTNVLVLAGPGSGKTRVIVHRIAYLVRVRREPPAGIVALTYNRHAAVEIRRRLDALIGDDSKYLTVMTCHALAMRLCGASFAERNIDTDADFDKILYEAAELLQGKDLRMEEAHERRERLLSGFRWICVDEYQDVDEPQYQLISALAGRTLQDTESRLNLLAVGDDDQNIYGFRGASTKYIRRFADDYKAKTEYLVENYRSTRHVIHAANRIIGYAAERQKQNHPITINRERAKTPAGGDWERLDPVARGCVQVLTVNHNSIHQAVSGMDELQRLKGLSSRWSWSKVAVIARKWEDLDPVRGYCALNEIPVQSAADLKKSVPVWKLRETQTLVRHLRDGRESMIRPTAVRQWIKKRGMDLLEASQRDRLQGAELRAWWRRGGGSWWRLLWQAITEYIKECGPKPLPPEQLLDWLAEWAREARRRQSGLLLLTAHRAKGLEFDHVVVFDGGWEHRDEDPESSRRLYYVAMTRARKNLVLCRFNDRHPFANDADLGDEPCFHKRNAPPLPVEIAPELHWRYEALSLQDVYIDYAGRFAKEDGIHKPIAALNPGDPLQLQSASDGWALCNQAGVQIGKLAKSFIPTEYGRCIKAHVTAILSRSKRAQSSEYAETAQCDHWEVVLPELVFEPD